ncbi:hypothetical protein Hanom_Chr08g00720731 [Helianthus anomalus]
MTEPAAEGCQSVTFITVPVALITQTPRYLFRLNCATHSATFVPLATSMIWLRHCQYDPVWYTIESGSVHTN